MHLIFPGIISVTIFFSCSPHASYFKSGNNVEKIEGTVYMAGGAVKQGLITVSFENEHERDDEIIFKPDNATASEKLDIRNIESYTIAGHTYVPKIINLYLSFEYHFLFVERLTAENDRMQLYRLLPSENGVVKGEEPSYYYVSFPSLPKYDVIDINSSRLVPEFDIKIAEYIDDCPALLSKIQLKNKKYYYTLLSLGSKRQEVIKNIVKEYNNCK